LNLRRILTCGRVNLAYDIGCKKLLWTIIYCCVLLLWSSKSPVKTYLHRNIILSNQKILSRPRRLLPPFSSSSTLFHFKNILNSNSSIFLISAAEFLCYCVYLISSIIWYCYEPPSFLKNFFFSKYTANVIDSLKLNPFLFITAPTVFSSIVMSYTYYYLENLLLFSASSAAHSTSRNSNLSERENGNNMTTVEKRAFY